MRVTGNARVADASLLKFERINMQREERERMHK